MDITALEIKSFAEEITVKVKVQPRSSRNAVVGTIGDCLKVALTSPPVEGAANEACIALFAELLNVPKRFISIFSGNKSRTKVIRIHGLSLQNFQQIMKNL